MARLLDSVCRVVGIARRTWDAAGGLPAAEWVTLDLAAARRPDNWFPYLVGIGGVVNCAGALQDSPFEWTRAVHVEGISTLFAACEYLGICRVVHDLIRMAAGQTELRR